jgi:hypothetical protein
MQGDVERLRRRAAREGDHGSTTPAKAAQRRAHAEDLEVGGVGAVFARSMTVATRTGLARSEIVTPPARS